MWAYFEILLLSGNPGHVLESRSSRLSGLSAGCNEKTKLVGIYYSTFLVGTVKCTVNFEIFHLTET